MQPKSKPVIPSRRFFTNQTLNASGMLYVTRRLIEKEGARGYAKAMHDVTGGKDWTHPKVRKMLDYMLKRNVFDVSFDSRTRYEAFFNKAMNIAIEGKREWVVHEELKLHVGKYVYALAIKEAKASKKPIDPSSASSKLVHAIERSFERADHLIKQINKIRPKKESLSHVKDKLAYENYYRINARDAFAHIGAGYAAFDIVAPELLKAAKEVERDMRQFSHR
ncbi:MAG: hypothetical protein AABW59_00935 [archaeon]